MINKSSNYEWKFGLGFTCGYCYRIDHKNYGCESCVWMKWFGELHGYPDLNPYTYRKHLVDDGSITPTTNGENVGNQAT